MHLEESPRDAENESGIVLSVSDDGRGMDRQTLRLALQFGGSMRFNSRRGMGRYGMGLPNGALSQARRVEVLTWQRPKEARELS
jgi:histidine kinase/DNA gyrase B/HSP90-like ATPase